MQPFFSIIVPIYNAQTYLEYCINSVLHQDYTDYELILVDDGSTDESGTICDRYASSYDQIRVFHKANSGQLHSRIFGLENAKGIFCVYLDADDYLDNNALSSLHSIVLEYDCDCVVFGFRNVNGNEVICTCTEKEDLITSDKHAICVKCFSSNQYNSMCRKAFRIESYSPENLSEYYHLRHGEDLLQSLGVIKGCDKFYFSHKVLYNYRINENSVTHNKSNYVERMSFLPLEAVLSFIEQIALFTVPDFDRYRRGRIKESLIPLIKNISIAEISIAKKREHYSNIRKQRYYKRFLSKRLVYCLDWSIESVILLLFKLRLDYMNIIILQIANKLYRKSGYEKKKRR